MAGNPNRLQRLIICAMSTLPSCPTTQIWSVILVSVTRTLLSSTGVYTDTRTVSSNCKCNFFLFSKTLSILGWGFVFLFICKQRYPKHRWILVKFLVQFSFQEAIFQSDWDPWFCRPFLLVIILLLFIRWQNCIILDYFMDELDFNSDGFNSQNAFYNKSGKTKTKEKSLDLSFNHKTYSVTDKQTDSQMTVSCQQPIILRGSTIG